MDSLIGIENGDRLKIKEILPFQKMGQILNWGTLLSSNTETSALRLNALIGDGGMAYFTFICKKMLPMKHLFLAQAQETPIRFGKSPTRVEIPTHG
jgi:hypothetical protein